MSKSKSGASDAPQPRSGAASLADANEVVRDARLRARRRLIGAALLLGVGIIGFPLLFETQPRPIAVDIPIEIPSREGAPPLQAPAQRPARPAPAQVAPPPVEPAVRPAEVKPAARPAEVKPAARPEPKPEAKVDSKPAEPPRPVAEAARPAESASKVEAARNSEAAKDDGRYVVQIGAFAEATGAREARMKVEALGLKTYTQVIESATGRRIRVRVGPYPTKAEADKAAARIKSGGLQAAVLVL
ncbi:SPOR domain-containing protein [Ideonella sp. YS5]|uniref:SPOR domain-containing protein n=1 Tax=Ideonella sp. YS5 TaxID=3453714 RepID=UPI003F71812B